VLDQHPELASAPFDRISLPCGASYEVWIEEWVTPHRRVEMQVVAKHDDGGEVAQLWSEHKRRGRPRPSRRPSTRAA
jgi:hypothetical protein